MRGGGGGMDMGGLLKQAQKQMRDLQRQMKDVDEDLKERIVEGSAGGGMVKAFFNGLGEAVDLRIDPSLMEEDDLDLIQEMILAAVRQGLKKSKELEEGERGKATGDLGIPGLSGMM